MDFTMENLLAFGEQFAEIQEKAQFIARNDSEFRDDPYGLGMELSPGSNSEFSFTYEKNTACDCHPEYKTFRHSYPLEMLTWSEEKLISHFKQKKEEREAKERAEYARQERINKEAEAQRELNELERLSKKYNWKG